MPELTALPCRRLPLIVALLVAASLVAASRPALAAGTLTPNDSAFQAGLNAAVWTNSSGGASPAAEVVQAANAPASGLIVRAVWMLVGGAWSYYIPQFASISTLQQVPPVANLLVVMEAPKSEPVGVPRAETVVTGLNIPWSLAHATDGRMFVTERPGLIRVIENGQLRAAPVADLRSEVAAQGEGGLLGIALDPAFSSNGFLYVYHTYSDAGQLRNRVVRLTEQGGTATGRTVILSGIPGASIHDGGRIAFGPDGKLYITTGDATQTALAQDPASLAGKILRINADGSIPADNPFSGSAVYSYGHRNVQGLAWRPGTGALYATEHGSSSLDEVNIITPGANYGWPTVRGIAADPRFSDPIAAYNPSIAPSGAAFYDGDRFPCWRGDLFFATLVGRHLHRLVLSDDGLAASNELLFDNQYGRLRSVTMAPDGYLYVLTNNRDGRGQPVASDDRLLRVSVTCGAAR